MTGPRYLIRLDDACPTMRRGTWDKIESFLDEADLRPLVAVVPNNRDPGLEVDPPDDGFWERVRAWASKGWGIGLHGYEHRYITSDRGFFGHHAASEFAGLSIDEQESRIRRGLGSFDRHGIRADAWVAPNHSFDTATLEALRRVGLTVVSDGLAVLPYREGPFLWIPQQTWRFEAHRRGVWTVCHHPNGWNEDRLDAFRSDVQRYRDRITDLTRLLDDFGERGPDLRDRWFAASIRTKKALRRAPSRLLARRSP